MFPLFNAGQILPCFQQEGNSAVYRDKLEMISNEAEKTPSQSLPKKLGTRSWPVNLFFNLLIDCLYSLLID